MLESLIEEFEKLSIKTTWHSFIQLPNVHCFGTYDVPETDFDGGDQHAMFKHITAVFTIFYKDSKTKADFELEKFFEDNIRFMGQFTKHCDFDSAHNLFFSRYVFEFGESY